jgi:sigma-B regulation protein RsbU (phosphoserine phosphatase)
LVRRRAGTFEEYTSGGMLLGVRDESDYQETCLELDAGDVMVIYSDGLTEARRGDEMFGVEGVQRVLDLQGHRRAADILEALLGEVRAWTDRALDDVTVVVLRQLTRSNSVRMAGPQNALKPTLVAADATR